MPLNLRRAFPNPLHPCVAPDALQRQVAHQPHAAVNLDRFVGHHGEHFRGFQLGHGHVHFGHCVLIIFPGRFVGEEFRCLQFHGHVGQLERHALEFTDLLAELHAVHRILLGQVQSAFGAAQTGGGNLQARCTQPFPSHFEALVQFA